MIPNFVSALSAIAVLCLAMAPDGATAHNRGRCGTADLSYEERNEMDNDFTSSTTNSSSSVSASATIPFQPVWIETYIHVIASTTGKGRLTQTDLDNSIQVLNDEYSGTALSFYLKGSTCTDSDAWFPLDSASTAMSDMKRALRKGGAATLNIYFVRFSDDTLGISTFPFFVRRNMLLDGVVVDSTTVPGGTAENYNEGKTLVHEVRMSP
jgi:hypothetical protein